MYRVITFKSKPLKNNVIYLGEVESSSSFDDETPKKRRRKAEEVTYMIDGVEVSEEDLTLNERMDIESESILNRDGFYTPLQPIDTFEKGEETERKKSGIGWKIALVIAASVAILVGVAVVISMLL